MTLGLWAAGVAAVLIFGTLAAYAQGTTAPSADAQTAIAKAAINVEDGWARATPGGSKNAAIYLRIVNTGKDADTLMGAESGMAEKTELHNSEMNGGMMQMTMSSAIDVPPASELKFQPGGRHVMLTGLKAPLKEGESFLVTLDFKKAGKVSAMVQVLAVNATGLPGSKTP